MTPQSLNVALIIEMCNRRKTLTLYLGGGLGALLLFGAADVAGHIFREAPRIFLPLFVTFALSAGSSLAYTYAGYDWEAVKLKRLYPVGATRSQAEEVWAPPYHTEILYKASLVFIGLAGLCLFLATWWPILPKLMEPWASW